MTTNDPNTPPAYNPPPVAPTVGPVTPQPVGPSALGVISFVAAVAAVVIGAILVFVGAQLLGGIVQYTGTSGQVTTLPRAAEGPAATGATLVLIGFVVFGLLALWGFIQGIFAIVKRRGRGWGIAAIIIAVLGIGIVSIFFGIGFGVGAAPYISSIR